MLRFWQLGDARRWYDEIFTGWASTLPLARLIQATAGDVHPPLYYALTWLVYQVAQVDTAWVMRLPSAVCSLLALPLLVAIGRRLKLSHAAILTASAFMAFSAFQLYYAQEARMYTLLQLEFLLAVWAMLGRRWWLLALASMGMVYTHNYGFVFMLTIYSLGAVRELGQPVLVSLRADYLRGLPWRNLTDKFDLRGMLLASLAPLVVYLPWLPTLQCQMTNLGTWWQQSTTLGSFVEPLYRFWWDTNLLGQLAPVGMLTAFALAAFALIEAVRRKNSSALQLVWLIVSPMAVSLALEGVTHHPTFLLRTFIGGSGLLFLLVAWALTCASRWTGAAAAVVLVPLFVVSTVSYHPMNVVLKGSVNDFIGAIHPEPGDRIYHMNPGSLMMFRENYQEWPGWYKYIHPPVEGNMGALTAETLAAFGVQQVDLDDLPPGRVWLVWSAGPTIGPGEDAIVADYVDRYAGQLVVDERLWYSDLYKGQIWLLQR